MPQRSSDTASSEDVEGSWTPEQKAEEALKMKRAGFSFSYIAKQLKYKSRASVVAAVKRGLKAEGRMVDKDMVRLLDNERVEEMFKFMRPKIQRGEPRAIEVGIRLLERRARMWGYDEVDRVSDKPQQAPVIIQYLAHNDQSSLLPVAEEDIIDLPMLPSHEQTMTKDAEIEEKIREYGYRDVETDEGGSSVGSPDTGLQFQEE